MLVELADPPVDGARVELRAGQLVQRGDDADVGRVSVVGAAEHLGQGPDVVGADVAGRASNGTTKGRSSARTRSASRLTWASRNSSADSSRYASTVVLATAAVGTRRRRAAARPTAAPTSGPSATFCGRRPKAPTTAPADVPTTTGPAPVNRPAAHPNGAINAEVVAMRCHNAGISPGRWRARATASETPNPTAPATAPIIAGLAPR